MNLTFALPCYILFYCDQPNHLDFDLIAMNTFMFIAPSIDQILQNFRNSIDKKTGPKALKENAGKLVYVTL